MGKKESRPIFRRDVLMKKKTRGRSRGTNQKRGVFHKCSFVREESIRKKGLKFAGG